MKQSAGAGDGSAAGNNPATATDPATGKDADSGNNPAASKDPIPGNRAAAGERSTAGSDAAAGRGAPADGDAGATTRRSHERVHSEPADFGGPRPEDREDQAERQGFDRQRLEPQDQPPADVKDRDNLAGDKDFELGPGS